MSIMAGRLMRARRTASEVKRIQSLQGTVRGVPRSKVFMTRYGGPTESLQAKYGAQYVKQGSGVGRFLAKATVGAASFIPGAGQIAAPIAGQIVGGVLTPGVTAQARSSGNRVTQAVQVLQQIPGAGVYGQWFAVPL